jgi:hypothetical protein
MVAYCSLCASDEATSSHVTDDGIAYAVCADSSHGEGGYIWEPHQPGQGHSRSSEGIGAEIGIWDKLLTLFEPGEDFVSYGDVEERFLDRYPTEFTLLLHRYGHKWRDPDYPSTQYSMSSYLAGRLRDLANEDQLDLTWRPAEGKWKHNEIISHWKPSA